MFSNIAAADGGRGPFKYACPEKARDYGSIQGVCPFWATVETWQNNILSSMERDPPQYLYKSFTKADFFYRLSFNLD